MENKNSQKKQLKYAFHSNFFFFFHKRHVLICDFSYFTGEL